MTGHRRLGCSAVPRVRRLYVLLAAAAVAVGLGTSFAVSAVGVDSPSVTIDPAAAPSAAGYVDLPHLSYADARDAVQTTTDMVIPIAIDGLEAVDVSQVTFAFDNAKRSLGLAGHARLPGVGGGTTDLDFLVSAVWPDDTSTSPAIALGAKAPGLDLSSLNPLWSSTFGPAPFDTARLIVSNRPQTLGPATLPAEVAGFYADPVDVAAGVAFQGDLHLTGRLAAAFGYAGYSDKVELEGTLAGSAALLFGKATQAEQGALSLAATLTKSATAPAWIQARTSRFQLSLTDGAPSVAIDDDVTVAVESTTNRFTGHVDVAPTGAVEGQLALVEPFQVPFDLASLTLANIRFDASYQSGAFTGALTADAAIADREPLHVRATLANDGDGTSASLSIDGSVRVPDLVAFAGDYLDVQTVPLPGVDDVSLDTITFAVENRTVDGLPETAFSLSAHATLRSLQAGVLLSLRKTGDEPLMPLLGLRITDPGCTPGGCIRLSQLFGDTTLGPFVDELQVPDVDLVVTSLPKLSFPSAAEARFFSYVYDTLPAELTFSPGIDVEVRLPLSVLGDEVSEALGFASDAQTTLRGTLGATMTLSTLGGTGVTLDELSLGAELPAVGGGSLLPRWLTVSHSRFSLAWRDGQIGAGVEFDCRVSLDGTGNDFDGTLGYTSDGRLDGQLALAGAFQAPFGLGRLSLANVALEASYDAGAFTGALVADARVTGRADPLHLRARLATDSSGSTTASLSIDGAVGAPDLLAFAGAYLGQQTPPTLPGLDQLTFTQIGFSVAKRALSGRTETAFSLTARTALRSLQADVLLSLRKTGDDPAEPLLALRLSDPGCTPADCVRLSQLLGDTQVGPLVDDLTLPAVYLVATPLRTLTQPTPTETAFFSHVYAALPAELTFEPGIDVEARLSAATLPSQVSTLLALDTSRDVVLRGTLGPSVTLSQLQGTDLTLDRLHLEADLPTAGTRGPLPSWLTLGDTALTLASRDGQVSAGLALGGHATLENTTNEFAGTLSYTSDGGLQGRLALVDTTFHAPFGLENLSLANVALEVGYQAGAFTAALVGGATVTGRADPLHVRAELATDGSGGTTASFSIVGSVAASDVVALADKYLGLRTPTPLPGVDLLTLDEIGFSVAKRTVTGETETVFSLTASTTLRSLNASVLLSLRKTGPDDPGKPLLALSITDPGCVPADCIRLSQLFGDTPLGPLVADLQVPAVDLVVTSLPTLVQPTPTESSFFANVYSTLPTLTFKEGVNLEARLPLSRVPAQIRTLLALDASGDLALRGSLGASVTLAHLQAADPKLDRLDLRAELKLAGTPPALPSWLTLDDAAFGLAYRDGGVSTGVELDGHVALDGTSNEFAGMLASTSDGAVNGTLALVGAFHAPFDLHRLTLGNVALDAGYDGSAFKGALTADATIAGRAEPLHLRAELATENGATSASFTVEGSVGIHDLVAFAGDYLDAQPAPLPGVDALTLSKIGFSLDKRTVDGVPESAFSLTAGAGLGSLQASVLLSLRKTGEEPVKPLLGLRIQDPGCTPAGCIRLSQLFGKTTLGPLVGDLKVPDVDLVITSLPRLSHLTAGEREFFANVYDSVPAELTFSPGIGLEARMPASWVPSEVRDLLALDTSGDLVLRGILGGNLTLSQLAGAGFTLDQLDLRAELPTAGTPTLLPSWISFRQPTVLKLLSRDATIVASFDTGVHVNLGGHGFDLDLAAAYSKTGATSNVALRATIPDWEHPFGVRWLSRLDSTTLKIDAVFGGGRSPVVTAGLSSSIVLGSSRTFDVAVVVSNTDSTSASITATFNGTATLGEMATAFSDLAGARSAIAAESSLNDLTIGPVAARAAVGGGGSFSLSAGTTLHFQSSSVAATVLATVGSGGSRGTNAGYTLGLKSTRAVGVRELARDAPNVPVSLSGAALVLSSRTAAIPSTELDDVEFDFYKTVYGCTAASTRANCTPFTVDLARGLKLVGTTTLPQSVQDVTATVGVHSDGPLVVEGTIPFGSMSSLSLTVSLPPVHLDNVDWLDSGQMSFSISPAGFKLMGALTVQLPRSNSAADASCPPSNRRDTVVYQGNTPTKRTLCYDVLTFTLSTNVGFAPASFQLTGALTAGGDVDGWHPAGLKWLAVKQLVLQLGAKSGATGPETTIGFRGSAKIGSKDVAASVLLKLAPLPGPPGVRIELQGISAQSTAGVALSDLIAVQTAVARAAGAPITIPTSSLPDVSFRNLYFSYSEVLDPDLCLKPGIRLNADLYVGVGVGSPVADPSPDPCAAPIVEDPAQRQTCTQGRSAGCFASVFLALDEHGISASGELGSFALGPLALDHPMIGLDLTAAKQALHLKGALGMGSFASGSVDVDVTKNGYHAEGDVQVFDKAFHAYLIADAPFDVNNPSFSARVVLREDFTAAFRNTVGVALSALKPVVAAFQSAYDLTNGTGGLAAFSTLKSTLTTAGVPVPSTVQTALDRIADIQKGIDDFSKLTGGVIHPTLALDTLLQGIKLGDFGGVDGTWTGRYCVGVKWRGKCKGYWVGPTCLGTKVIDGHCWAVPPISGPRLTGLCFALGINANDRSACSFNGLMRRYVLPPVVSALNTATGLSLTAADVGTALQTMSTTLNPSNQSTPALALDCVEFAAGLTDLSKGQGDVSLATRLKLFGTQLNIGAGWSFSKKGNDAKAAAWNVVKQLLSPQKVTCQGFPEGREQAQAPSAAQLTGALSRGAISESGSATFHGAFDARAGGRYPAVTLRWGDGTTTTVAAGSARTFSRSHSYSDDGVSRTGADAYPVSAVVQDAGGDTTDVDLTVKNVAPAITRLAASPAPAREAGVVTATGRFTDPGARDTHEVTLDWGDGTAATTLTLAKNARSFKATHRYVDDNAADAYTVKATVADDDNGGDGETATAAVRNVAPQIASIEPVGVVSDEEGTVVPYPGRVDEGSLVVYRIDFTDPGTLDTFTATVDWNDGSPATTLPVPAGLRSVLVDHQFADDVSPDHPTATYAIAATIADDDGGTATATQNQEVRNVAPTTAFSADVSAPAASGTVTIAGTVTDPGALDSHTVDIDWGDGKPHTVLHLPAGEVDWVAAHVYADDNPSGTIADINAIEAVVTDDDAGATSTVHALTVHDDVPTLDAALGRSTDSRALLRLDPAEAVRDARADPHGALSDGNHVALAAIERAFFRDLAGGDGVDPVASNKTCRRR